MIDGEIRLSNSNNKKNRSGGHSSESDFTISRPALFFYTMKDAYYFPHDSNASTDPKILHIRQKWGWAGYGMYFAILEKFRDSSNYKLPSDAQATLHLCLNHPKDEVDRFIQDCLDVGLFIVSEGYFFSESFVERMRLIEEKRNKYRESGRLGGLASHAQATLKHRSSKERKGKERKVNIIRENISIPPNIDLVIKYFQEIMSTTLEANKFFDHFQSNGWRVGGKAPMKNWQAAARSWVRRSDEFKKPEKKPEGRKYEDLTGTPLPQRPEVDAEGLAKISALTADLKNKMGKK